MNLVTKLLMIICLLQLACGGGSKGPTKNNEILYPINVQGERFANAPSYTFAVTCLPYRILCRCWENKGYPIKQQWKQVLCPRMNKAQMKAYINDF